MGADAMEDDASADRASGTRATTTKDRGRGLVLPRTTKKRSVQPPPSATPLITAPPPGLGGMAVVEAPACDNLALPQMQQLAIATSVDATPPPRFPEWMSDGAIPSFAAGASTSDPSMEAALRLARRFQPIVLTSFDFAARLAARWSLSRLADGFSPDGSRRRFAVQCAMDSRHRFFACDASKNAYGSYYHVREPENVALNMTFPEFATCARTWQEKHVALTEVVMRQSLPPEAAGVRARAAAMADARRLPQPTDVPHALRHDLTSELDWAALTDVLASMRAGAVREVRLRCGTRNGLTPARYAPADALLCQVDCACGPQRVP